jgi:hypothetical protein
MRKCETVRTDCELEISGAESVRMDLSGKKPETKDKRDEI